MPSPTSSTLDQIKALEAQIVSLRQKAVSELQQKKSEILDQVAQIDAEIERLTGQSKPRKQRKSKGPQLRPSLRELKEILENLPGKTLNIRQGNYELANIRTLANANPHLLRISGNGAWPTVTMLK